MTASGAGGRLGRHAAPGETAVFRGMHGTVTARRIAGRPPAPRAGGRMVPQAPRRRRMGAAGAHVDAVGSHPELPCETQSAGRGVAARPNSLRGDLGELEHPPRALTIDYRRDLVAGVAAVDCGVGAGAVNGRCPLALEPRLDDRP